MTVAVVVLGVLLLALLAVLLRTLDRHNDQVSGLIATHARERSELISRVQRPDLIPAQEIRQQNPDDLERRRMVQRELNRVGTVAPLEADQ